MANKRESSSQRRQRENRARRAALEARTKGAPPARPSRVAPATAEKLKARSADAGSSKASSAAGPADDAATTTKRGKPRRQRPPRPGDTPVDVTTLEGSWFARIVQVPGGTQAAFAGLMALVATGLTSFTATVISEADEGKKNAAPTQTIFEAYPLSTALPLVVIPLLIALAAVWFSFHPQRRRIWFVATIALAAIALVAAQFYLFVSGFLAYACFRAAKVEGPNPSLFAGRRKRAEAATAAPDGTTDEGDADA